jgi:hypothetical protein
VGLDLSQDCLTYHFDPMRTGQNRKFNLDDTKKWGKYCEINVGSAVRGAPLFLSQHQIRGGPHNGETHEMVFIATSDNQVYAFAEDELIKSKALPITPIWSQTLGSPSQKGGSNIPAPIGVSSTPVLDSQRGRMFVLAMREDNNYYFYSLDIDTGTILHQAQLHDSGDRSRATFDGSLQDQRGGLNLISGRIYATFADFLAFDKSNYHGWLVSSNADNLNDQWFFPLTSNSSIGGGIWGPGGAAAAADNTLYVVTGNRMPLPPLDTGYWLSLAATGKHPAEIGDYFIAVVRIGVRAGTNAPTVIDWYQPHNIFWMNGTDLDLGGSSALLLPDIKDSKGAVHELLVTSGKDGYVYLLNRANLGHWGNELWRQHVFSAESKCAPAYFESSTGDHYVYVVGSGTPGLVAYKVLVDGGTTPQLHEVWRAAGSGISLGDAPGSPEVVTANGASDLLALVWIVDDNTTPPSLRAFGALDGKEVFNSSSLSQDNLGDVPHFPPISIVGKSVFVGTKSGLACYAQNARIFVNTKCLPNSKLRIDVLGVNFTPNRNVKIQSVARDLVGVSPEVVSAAITNSSTKFQTSFTAADLGANVATLLTAIDDNGITAYGSYEGGCR